VNEDSRRASLLLPVATLQLILAFVIERIDNPLEASSDSIDIRDSLFQGFVFVWHMFVLI
jgi:hypothetical protein